MEHDDDMVVIIVGEKNMKIKQEFTDQIDCTSTSQEPPNNMLIVKEEIMDVPVEFETEAFHEDFIYNTKVEEVEELEELEDAEEIEKVEFLEDVQEEEYIEAEDIEEMENIQEVGKVENTEYIEEGVNLECQENIDDLENGENIEYVEVENLQEVQEHDPLFIALDTEVRPPKQPKRKNLTPSQKKSLVEELRQSDPKLAKNKNLLISKLVSIMRSVKPPPLPLDYYTVNGIMLECMWCARLTETIAAAGRHYQEKHGQRYLICYACGADFKSTTTLYVHEKRCTSPDAPVMLLARAIFLGNKGKQRPFLQQAKKYMPNIPPPVSASKKPYRRFGCDICPAAFVSKTGLMAHMHLHNGQRPYRCHQCPRAYTSPNALSRHMKKHSDIKFVCDHCSRPFKEKGALVAHLEIHQPLQKFACVECGRRFAQKFTMQRHYDRKHLNAPPPCACKLCPLRFRRTTLLKEHMRKDHGVQLMTKKMFFKELPAMTDAQVLARAFKF